MGKHAPNNGQFKSMKKTKQKRNNTKVAQMKQEATHMKSQGDTKRKVKVTQNRQLRQHKVRK